MKYCVHLQATAPTARQTDKFNAYKQANDTLAAAPNQF